MGHMVQKKGAQTGCFFTGLFSGGAVKKGIFCQVHTPAANSAGLFFNILTEAVSAFAFPFIKFNSKLST